MTPTRSQMRLHVREDVGREEDRLPAALQLEDEVADLLAPDGVEPAHRLVEHDEGGIAGERLGDAEPLLHALRVLPDLPVGGVGQPDQLEQLVHAASAVRADGTPERRSEEPSASLPVRKS